jgi:ribosomal protein S12 methylthiotransferase accessory factor
MPATPAEGEVTWSDDLREDVLRCQQIVARQGLEMLVLDQTRPDIGLPVVKVIVPGLRHFWVRLGPGRLYDAPVKLGWLEEPLAEDQLNPIPMFV